VNPVHDEGLKLAVLSGPVQNGWYFVFPEERREEVSEKQYLQWFSWDHEQCPKISAESIYGFLSSYAAKKCLLLHTYEAPVNVQQRCKCRSWVCR